MMSWFVNEKKELENLDVDIVSTDSDNCCGKGCGLGCC